MFKMKLEEKKMAKKILLNKTAIDASYSINS